MTGGRRAVDIPALTGLRAFAAAVVVAHHLRPVIDVTVPGRIAELVRPLLAGGMLGVDVFFVLSGFVIAHNYADRLADPAPRARRDFLHARVSRIYPLHIVTFAFWVALAAAGGAQRLDIHHTIDQTPLTFVGNLLMLQALPGIPAWNYPAWSISCEIAAYILFPLLAARLLRLRTTTACALAVAALLLQLAVMHGSAVAGHPLDTQLWPRIAGEFAAGALLWVVWHRALRPGRWADAVVVLCLGATVWLLWCGYPWPWAIPLLAALVLAVACATGPVATLLAHPVAQWGGRVSYAFYLVHATVIAVAVLYVVPVDVYVYRSTATAVLILSGIVVTCVAVAALLHHGVEEPARRWMRRRFTARTVTPASEPAGAAARASG